MTSWLRGAARIPVLMGASLAVVSADQTSSSRCLMQAPRAVYAMPPQGFIDADEPNKKRACEPVTSDWIRGSLGAAELGVNPAGPEGSGRYWVITVGLSPRVGAEPIRGLCLQTSTAGFPALRSFGDKGLPWVADRDGDNTAEFIFWSSFFLTPRLQQSEAGLVAWVYRVDVKTGRLLLDVALSRRMAEEIAAAYKTPLGGKAPASDGAIVEQRRLAAAALDAFAADRCTLPQEPRR